MVEDRWALGNSHLWHLHMLRLRRALGRGLEGLGEVEDRAEGRVGVASWACPQLGLSEWGSEPHFSSLTAGRRITQRSWKLNFANVPGDCLVIGV